MQCCVMDSFDPRWDKFVLDQPAGTFFHQWKWRRLLQEIFGYEPHYLYVEDSAQIIGVLPLFFVRSALFGKSLVAMPLGVYGGVVAISTSAEKLLLDHAVDIARRTRAKYLELRGNPYSQSLPATVLNGSAASVQQKDLYFTFIGSIDSGDDANFAKIPRKQRRMIRQSQKTGLKAIFDNNRLREFYEIYAQSVRNLGTPVFGYSYFQRLLAEFSDRCVVELVEFEGKVVAGVLSFFFKDQVLPYYGGAIKECHTPREEEFASLILVAAKTERDLSILNGIGASSRVLSHTGICP
jgi:FemAB-related protein (PEP-CTERM system-associated)